MRFAVFALVGELLGRNATRWVRQCQSTSSQPVPERAGPTLGGETVTQAREAQVDLAAGERLPRRVPRQRIDDDLGGGAPSSSWPIRFSQTPAVARRWPATGWRRSTGWYRPWLPRDTAGLGPPGRAALPSTSQDHINRSLHGFRGLPVPRCRGAGRRETGQGSHGHHPHHTDQHPRPARLLRRHLHPAPPGEFPPRTAVHGDVRRRPGTAQGGLTPTIRRHRPDPHHPDDPMTDRPVAATPDHPPSLQDPLRDAKINSKLRGGSRLRNTVPPDPGNIPYRSGIVPLSLGNMARPDWSTLRGRLGRQPADMAHPSAIDQ